MDLEARVDGLYRTDPKRFVAERDSLAKQLKGDGDREAAERIKGLRKPTQAAWALNAVAHEAPEQVEELLRVGRELREAQELAVGGGGNRSLRAVSERRRDVIGALTAIAIEQVGEAQRDRIEATLEAASVDAEVGDQLRAGRLVSDHDRPSGFTGLEGLLAASMPERAPRDDARTRQLEEDVRSADAELERLASELDRARERLEEARGAVATVEQQLRDAEHRRSDLRAQLDAVRPDE